MEFEYPNFATTKQFIKISGITTDDYKTKVLADEGFRKHIKKFEGNTRNHYIEVKPALEYIKNELLIKEVN